MSPSVVTLIISSKTFSRGSSGGRHFWVYLSPDHSLTMDSIHPIKCVFYQHAWPCPWGCSPLFGPSRDHITSKLLPRSRDHITSNTSDTCVPVLSQITSLLVLSWGLARSLLSWRPMVECRVSDGGDWGPLLGGRRAWWKSKHELLFFSYGTDVCWIMAASSTQTIMLSVGRSGFIALPELQLVTWPGSGAALPQLWTVGQGNLDCNLLQLVRRAFPTIWFGNTNNTLFNFSS